jgi:N6-adenosine-specific RNA methylase IME4
MYLINNNNVFWIVEKLNGKRKYLKKLGRISKVEAQEQLTIWKEETKRLEEWKTQISPMPEGEFDVIYADPPWRYDFSKSDNRAIENQYPTMEVSDICKLKVPAAENSVLFLWGTAPKLLEAMEVIKAWGFQYKTNAVWDKRRIGMGYYFRIQHEHLFIATKGSPGVPDEKSRPDSIFSQAKTQHSAKPLIVYDIIEAAYPDKRYLELFGRIKRENWITWGNQI